MIGHTTPQTMPSREPGVNRRYHALDGLRGLAALVVLICHALLVKPELIQAYVDPGTIERGTVWWWASFSPLHLFWAGTEAVFIFFILSGFVLTLPFARGSNRGWLSYFPKRLVRLYLPVWGAFVLSAMWMIALPRQFPESASIWLQAHTSELTAQAVRGDLLLFPVPGFTNPALWSLRFEVVFSLVLFVFILLGKTYPRLNLFKAVLLIGAVVAFADTRPSFRFFLPMFGLGALMALEYHRLAWLGDRIRNLRFNRTAWAGLTVGSLVLLNSHWTVLGLTTETATLGYLIPISQGLITAGACLLIFVVVQAGEGGWLSSGPARWLGSRSFSLYLVHGPIVVSCAVLFGGQPGLLLSLAIAVPASLVVAEAFYRTVDLPSHRLAQRVERSIESRRKRSHVLPEPPLREAVLVPSTSA